MGVWNGDPKNHAKGSGNGAPMGNDNHSRTRPWKDAINRALSKKGKCERAEELYLIAREVVECAQDRTNENFQYAVKEIGLRLDGKPTEHIDVTSVTAAALGISAALKQLSELTGRGEVIDGEIIMPDRSLLPAEVCAEEGGHREGVDIPAMSGDTREP